MPEVILCKDCKQSINKEADQYVMIEKATDRYPEVLAHVACEQKRATAGLGIDRRIRSRYSARHLSLAAAAAGSNGQGVGDDAPAVGLEERVVRLERAMTTTLDLLQQMRRSQASLKPLDPLNS